MFSYDFDTMVSDPSDPNTNSFSDDTEDKSQKNADPEIVGYFIIYYYFKKKYKKKDKFNKMLKFNYSLNKKVNP